MPRRPTAGAPPVKSRFGPAELHAHLRRMRPPQDHEILRRLLTDRRMESAWAQIEKRWPRNKSYIALWTEIRVGVRKAGRTEESPARVRRALRKIAAGARKLAGRLDGNDLDLLAYEYFPEDSAKLVFQSADWSTLDGPGRASRVPGAGAAWPSLPAMLAELVNRAELRAAAARASNPLTKRTSPDVEARRFVAHMARYFRKTFGYALRGTLASVASAALNTDIGEELVKSALRPGKKGGAQAGR